MYIAVPAEILGIILVKIKSEKKDSIRRRTTSALGHHAFWPVFALTHHFWIGWFARLDPSYRHLLSLLYRWNVFAPIYFRNSTIKEERSGPERIDYRGKTGLRVSRHGLCHDQYRCEKGHVFQPPRFPTRCGIRSAMGDKIESRSHHEKIACHFLSFTSRSIVIVLCWVGFALYLLMGDGKKRGQLEWKPNDRAIEVCPRLRPSNKLL
ncbi:hypothetical protein ACH5RR_028836 [Cinchona calisaya]|uniref:Uncharacterized protein n=1 Tax=Cinchona calisaya TaxID=153742 RepID=A0ABD2YPX8_9GENT